MKELEHITEMSIDLKYKLFDEFTQTFKTHETDLKTQEVSKPIGNPMWGDSYQTIGGVDWCAILNDLIQVCSNYFTITEKDFDCIDNRQSGSTCKMNQKHSNKLVRIQKIELNSIYPNKIYSLILEKKMFFNVRYIEFIFPLVMELRKYLKHNIDKSSKETQMVVKIFLNHFYGTINSTQQHIRSNISTGDISDFYNEILQEMFDRVDDIVFIDTDEIYYKNNETTRMYIENVLNMNKIDYDIENVEDIGLFTNRREFIIFDKDVQTKKTRGMKVYE